MSFERPALARAVSRHGTVVRVVVAEVRGSAPREVGAAMLVWNGGQSGTIGGGTLEYNAALSAREMLAAGEAKRFSRAALGPDLGQCCGGSVALLSEAWDQRALDALGKAQLFARPVEAQVRGAGAGTPPLAVSRLLAEARGAGAQPGPQLVGGWFAEPLFTPASPVWIWGAGHVGRALVETLAPLPTLAITWVDTAPNRFPDRIPQGVTALPAPDLAQAAAAAPAGAHHLIVTYSHALDLALCDALLGRGFASAGLIGSATKWARFRTRLGQMGHGAAAIARIQCPIGTKALGKHPQAIAVGVAHALLMVTDVSACGTELSFEQRKFSDSS